MVVNEDSPNRIVLQGEFQDAARVDSSAVNRSLGQDFSGDHFILGIEKDAKEPFSSFP
jgi:hypothetical protein